MKYVVKIAGCALMAISINSYCGLFGTTAASRANCMNNESVVWNAQQAYMWRSVSIHQHVNGSKSTYYNHLVDTGWHLTKRAAAVHWGESPDVGKYLWNVNGYFFFEDYANGKWPFKEDYTRDCSLYDGWWGWP